MQLIGPTKEPFNRLVRTVSIEVPSKIRNCFPAARASAEALGRGFLSSSAPLSCEPCEACPAGADAWRSGVEVGWLWSVGKGMKYPLGVRIGVAGAEFALPAAGLVI